MISGLVGASLAHAGCGLTATEATNSDLADTTPDSGVPGETGGERAALLSAFFGLDNGLFQIANLICSGAAGKDGMPVIFSAEIDHSTMQAGDAERKFYKVTGRAPDGTTREIVPAALANLGDGDNNHVLCLDSADRAVSVSFPGGIL